MDGTQSIRQSGGERGVSFGGWLQIGHTAPARILAASGLEWVAVDLEHGAIDISQCPDLIQAIRGEGAVPLARIPYNDIIWIRRCLDAGFRGIIVPLVSSAEEARRAVRVAKYPPDGERGIGFAAANRFGARLSNESLQQENSEIAVIVQIETAAGVENLEEILAVDGVDGMFIGPYDLSGSYGVLGQFDHPVMLEAYRKCLDCCSRTGMMAGVHVVAPDAAEVRRRLEQGFDLIALSLDVTLLMASTAELVRGALAAASDMGLQGGSR